MKLQVRDMAKHLRLFNTMIEGSLFKNISYMKKPELEKNFNKYFKAEEFKGKTIYYPQFKGKLNLLPPLIREKFHKIAPEDKKKKKPSKPVPSKKEMATQTQTEEKKKKPKKEFIIVKGKKVKVKQKK